MKGLWQTLTDDQWSRLRLFGLFLVVCIYFFWSNSNDQQKALEESRVEKFQEEINTAFADPMASLKYIAQHSKFYAGLDPYLRRLNALMFNKMRFQIKKCYIENSTPKCDGNVTYPGLTGISFRMAMETVALLRKKQKNQAENTMQSIDQTMLDSINRDSFPVETRYFSVMAIVNDEVDWSVDAGDLVRELESLVYYR